MKFENIDLVDALRRIMDIHTQNYKEDFELDAGLLHSLAASQSSEDKHLLWMSRPNGTYLLPEREVYVEDSYETKCGSSTMSKPAIPYLPTRLRSKA